MDHLTIRPAQLEDAHSLARLLQAIGWFKRIEAEDPGETTARVLAHLRLCLSDESHTVLVAADASGRVIAYISIHWLPYLFLPGPEGYVSELFVDPGARGMGVGKQLLTHAVEQARARGCSRLQLLNGRERESYRRRFYEQNGWQERDMANFIYPIE